MENCNPYPSASDWGPERFARLVETWAAEHGVLLDALIVLRSQAEAQAVDAVLRTSEVRQLRLSWELWEAMREGTAPETEAAEELRPQLGDSEFDWYRAALWGDGSVEGDGARLRLIS